MKQNGIYRKLVMALALMSFALIPMGVVAGAGSAGASGTVKVFMIPKFTGIAPFTDAAAGGKGIFISNDDAATTNPALVRAEHHGVKVVTFDSDALPSGRTVYVEGSSTAAIAISELEMLGSQMTPAYTGSF